MRGGVHRYAAQASLRIDAATAEKSRFRMKTLWFFNPGQTGSMNKVLIISTNAKATEAYRKAVSTLGSECEVAKSIEEMQQILRNRPFNGLILDVLTAVRAPHKDKPTIQRFSEIYPTFRARWDEKNHKIRGMVLGRSLDKADPLGAFLEMFCRHRPARVCRVTPRYRIHFNVLLSRDANCAEAQAEKTVTLDISRGGCFLISNQDWQGTKTAWVRFRDIPRIPPVQVEIRHFCAWGHAMQVPGIGVEFQQMDPLHLETICRHFPISTATDL